MAEYRTPFEKISSHCNYFHKRIISLETKRAIQSIVILIINQLFNQSIVIK